MGVFDDCLVATASAFTDVFAETVTYKPSVGDAREIEAIVVREPAEKTPGMPHGLGPKLKIDVENDSTTGISTDEINTGGDLVNLSVRIGESAQDRAIVGIESQDAGRAIYEVR